MTKTIYYMYMGTNGVILTPIHLEDIYYTRRVKLFADKDKKLTKDGINFRNTVIIPEDETSEWYEVNKDGFN